MSGRSSVPDLEPLSAPASRCDECDRLLNRRGECPDLGCPGPDRDGD